MASNRLAIEMQITNLLPMLSNNSSLQKLLSVVACVVLVGGVCLAKSPVDYVNPLIGTDEHGHVYPGATVPFGMVQLSPDTRTDTWDGSSGYHYSDDRILGFSHNHLTGTGCPDLGNVLLIPTIGKVRMTPGPHAGEGYSTHFSHKDESARPGYYSVMLPDYGVKVELTATERVGLHRYTFPKSDAAHVILDAQHGIGNGPTDALVKIEDDHTVSGYRRSDGWGGDKVYYFVAEFSKPFISSGVGQVDTDAPGKESRGRETKGHFDFKTKAGEQILVRVALSTVSVENARKNLRVEMPGWDFDGVARAARKEWENALDALSIKTDDENLKQTFYTAFYHASLAPTMLSDVDGQYRGPDKKVHLAKNFTFYSELSLWDTFRAEHPLLTLVQPTRVNDFVNTMLEHARNFEEHTLPVWTESGKENWCMIGNHAIPVMTDAYQKGFRGWPAEEALAAMIASTDKDRADQKPYREKGFIPTGKDVQSVSKLLEYAYDDACIARFAKSLGKADVAGKYAKRSQNWQNVFDGSTGFMRGKDAAGNWVTPFDSKSIGFNEYTEANAWQYTFFVPHNVPGLIGSMGGDEKFVAKLDEMFDTQVKIPNQLSDVTGVIGMYAHGNEPCHHVAYLYNYAGQPWKTQERTRYVASMLYTNTPGGICGNDDCGQTSAWYVFTAMGFYPVDPASGIYVLGSPLVDKVTLNLDRKFAKSGSFTVEAKNNSSANRYVQSATLNGKAITRSWISHDEIMAGGTLVLNMGAKPNKEFGSATADRPPKI